MRPSTSAAAILAVLLAGTSAASARTITDEDKAKCEQVAILYQGIAKKRDVGIAKGDLQKIYIANVKNTSLRNIAINIIEKVYGDYKDKTPQYIHDISKAECVGRINNVNQ